MKIFKATMIALVIFGLFSSYAWSQDMAEEKTMANISGRLGIGYNYGWIDEKDNNNLGNIDLDLTHSINLTYGFTKMIALSIEGTYASNYDYDNEWYMAFADLQLRFPKEKWVPYIFAGIGSQNKHGDKMFDRQSFTARAGLGVEYFLNKSWSLNLDGFWMPDIGDDTFEGWQVRGGVKYYFGS